MLAALLLAASCAAQQPPTASAFASSGGGEIIDVRFISSGSSLAVSASGKLLHASGTGPWSEVSLPGAPFTVGGIFYNDLLASENVLVYERAAVDSTHPVRLVVSRDAGNNWQPAGVLPGGGYFAILDGRLHPLDKDAVLLLVMRDPVAVSPLCARKPLDKLGELRAFCRQNDLLISYDFGNSWRSAMSSGISGFVSLGWGPQSSRNFSDKTILATGYLSEADRRAGIYYNGFWDPLLHLFFSDTSFATKPAPGAGLSTECGNEFTITRDSKVFLASAAGCDKGPVTPDSGAGLNAAVQVIDASVPQPSWAPSCFPVAESNRDFHIYDTARENVSVTNLQDGRQAFALVDHSSADDPVRGGMAIGVLYAADWQVSGERTQRIQPFDTDSPAGPRLQF